MTSLKDIKHVQMQLTQSRGKPSGSDGVQEAKAGAGAARPRDTQRYLLTAETCVIRSISHSRRENQQERRMDGRLQENNLSITGLKNPLGKLRGSTIRDL